MVERPAEVGKPSPNCVTKAIPCWRKVGLGPIHLCQFEPDGSFVRDAIQDGTILPSYVPTEVQLADIFTGQETASTTEFSN